MKNFSNDTVRVKQEHLGKSLFQYHFLCHKYHKDLPGMQLAAQL
jgi:hypothetical protein